MQKYFSLDSLKIAITNLEKVDGKWILIPLVLAANGVTRTKVTNLQDGLGSDSYLDRFFDGKLIGLQPKDATGTVNIRPPFLDIKKSNDLAIRGYRKIWANVFSQSGYRNWRDNGILEKTTKSNFQLSDTFSSEFRKSIADDFEFEDLLIWLYAFSGFNDSIDSWGALFNDFITNHTATGEIPEDYSLVFKLTPNRPWPTDLIDKRPSNDEFIEFFFPGATEESISPDDYGRLFNFVKSEIEKKYISLEDDEPAHIAASIISGLQSCKRIFLMGEPGAGKSELAKLVMSAFDAVFQDRIYSAFVPISEASTPDKLIGFSTIDGSWIPGAITAENKDSKRQLLYSRDSGSPPSLSEFAKRQINIIVLDEANRRDVESLLARLQSALDGNDSNPDSDNYRVILDNSGERYLSPYTFIVMTGNSPREDSGRVVQSRPFKRRHNLIMIPNAFERALLTEDSLDFINSIIDLWQHHVSSINIPSADLNGFEIAIKNSIELIDSLKEVLLALHDYSIGITYGLVRKILITAATRYSLTKDFSSSLDHGLSDSILPLLSSDAVINGNSLKQRLEAIPKSKAQNFPCLFNNVDRHLRNADEFNRVRHFF